MRVECVKPNIILYSSALKACLNVGTLEQCHALHTDIIYNGLEIDAVAGNTLVNIYIKGGSVIGAQKVFDVMTEKDAITWNSLIYGYVENGGQNTHILKLYNDMIEAGMIPDRVTFLCVLKACDGIESSHHGRLLHASILLWDVGLDMSIGNALIDMYSRSGSIEDAKHVFTNMPSIDVVSFGTVIAGYAEHGNCDMVTHCLQIMRHQGTMPDARILSSVLTACSQTGQIQEAQHYLLSMREDPGINLTVEHFNLIADLIARAGHLSDAKHLLESLPTQVDAFGWMSLLSACGIYGNKDLAQRCFKQAVKLEPHCAAEYILLSNLLNTVASN
jgi:pentatricopeptide repeat protein